MYLLIETDKCTGCRTCETFCSFRWKKEINPAVSAITIQKQEKEGVYIPVVCLQCRTPLCLEACAVNAISRDPRTGAVVINEEECVGCKACISACPFGGMGFDAERGVARKCDLCGGDPECIKGCPRNIIHLVREEKAGSIRKRQALENYISCLTSVEKEI